MLSAHLRPQSSSYYHRSSFSTASIRIQPTLALCGLQWPETAREFSCTTKSTHALPIYSILRFLIAILSIWAHLATSPILGMASSLNSCLIPSTKLEPRYVSSHLQFLSSNAMLFPIPRIPGRSHILHIVILRLVGSHHGDELTAWTGSFGTYLVACPKCSARISETCRGSTRQVLTISIC